MLHPSYYDLMEVVNSSVEQGEEPVVSSRYSIVIATAKRARQIIDGDEAMVEGNEKKPLSLAVDEINQGKVKILPEGSKVVDEIMFTDSELVFIDENVGEAEGETLDEYDDADDFDDEESEDEDEE